MTLPDYAMNQETFPQQYERWLVGPLFRPWAEILLDEVRPSPRDRILDIACGTGIVARLAKQRLDTGGAVVGVDISADVLTVARAAAPDIDWREGNAGALPLNDGEQFDVVVCQQGLQFFPDKPAAVAEMRRALVTEGRLAVAVWRSDEEMPFFRELRDVAERHIGPVADQRYGYGEPGPIEALLGGAGFHDVRSRTVTRRLEFSDGMPFLRLNAIALVGMSAAGKAMSGDERKRAVDRIASDSTPLLGRYRDGAGIAFETSANLATARG
jgi:ubiquinone/menaquinone biosynthesis C-methylase UbiE